MGQEYQELRNINTGDVYLTWTRRKPGAENKYAGLESQLYSLKRFYTGL